MNTLLSIQNSSNKGKTETLREFSKLLLQLYSENITILSSNKTVPVSNDFTIVVQIQDQIVGIISQGDPNTHLQEKLTSLYNNYKCNVIVCSSRTRGETVKAINNFSRLNNFKLIKSSTYQINLKSEHSIVNELKAKHLLELLQTLKIISTNTSS